MSIADQPAKSALVWSGDRLKAIACPLLTKSNLDRLAIGFFVLMLTAVATVGLIKPEYNWDMAPYVAASIQDDVNSIEALHKKTWGMIETRASDGQLYRLQAQNPYNLHTYQHPDAFHSMLPMYEVKVAYVAAIRVLGKLIGPVEATIWISVVAALMFGGICMVWMQRGGFVQAAPVVVALLLLSGFFYMPRLASPDMLFAALCFGGIYLLLQARDIAALPLLFTAFLVRPDNIIFLFTLPLAALLFDLKRVGLATLFAASLASYFWITSGNDHPGWWAHFYFSNVEIQNTMIGFHPEFALADYLKGVARGILMSLQNNNWPKLMIVLLFGWALLARSKRLPNRRATAMLVAIILCFGGKFVTFPLPDDRTYFVYVVAFAMILLEAWKPRLDLNRTVRLHKFN